MPVYVKQWKDGDFTIVFGKDLDDAVRILNQTACVEPATILQLNAGDLSVEFTLSENGEVVVRNLTPAVAEAREVCCPALMAALKGTPPEHVSHPDHQQLVANAVDDEMKVRKRSKLDERLARQVPRTRPSRART